MMDREHLLNQGIAVFCIVFGALCVYIASHHDWREKLTLGAGISGAGMNAVTAQLKQYLTNKDGGTINVTPPEEK